jgi:hypothetical protein
MKRYPAAPTWQLKPFAHHIDGGFGAIGDAFHGAAERLDQSVTDHPFHNSSLPAAYLHRHATELYLKACIMVIPSGARNLVLSIYEILRHPAVYGIPLNDKQKNHLTRVLIILIFFEPFAGERHI